MAGLRLVQDWDKVRVRYSNGDMGSGLEIKIRVGDKGQRLLLSVGDRDAIRSYFS